MKIYLFNPENGFYLGEDFADEAPMGMGTHAVPGDATTIPPPPSRTARSWFSTYPASCGW